MLRNKSLQIGPGMSQPRSADVCINNKFAASSDSTRLLAGRGPQHRQRVLKRKRLKREVKCLPGSPITCSSVVFTY